MFEYGQIGTNFSGWNIIPPHFSPREDDFNRLHFRINGTEYTKYNKEFKAAVMWYTLKYK